MACRNSCIMFSVAVECQNGENDRGDVIRVILNWVKFIKAKPAYDKLREFSFKDVGVFTRQGESNKNMLSLCIMGIVGASVVGAFPIHRAKSQGI